jgi:hypothetical protein
MSAWEKFSRTSHTKWYGRTYDFSQIHQDNHYKCPGARPITKMKIGQLESQNLAWGRPHFHIKEGMSIQTTIFNILFISFE